MLFQKIFTSSIYPIITIWQIYQNRDIKNVCLFVIFLALDASLPIQILTTSSWCKKNINVIFVLIFAAKNFKTNMWCKLVFLKN